MNSNVKCLTCSKEWNEQRIKTLRGKEEQGLRIAFHGGNRWNQICCIDGNCKGTVVRKELSGKIADHQLNKWSAQNKEYAKK